jgi:hypothetical protein
MLAISALSIANRTGAQHTEAMSHYERVLPAIRDSMQNGEDPLSDGILFTHYLLLLYEVSTAVIDHY